MIKENQELHRYNLVSKRQKITQNEMPYVIDEIKKYAENNQLKIKDIISVSFSNTMENNEQIIDNECIVEFTSQITNNILPDGYKNKNELLITNALNLSFKGNQQLFLAKYNEIANYIASNKLQPITPMYTVIHNPLEQLGNEVDLDIYIGINPNIL